MPLGLCLLKTQLNLTFRNFKVVERSDCFVRAKWHFALHQLKSSRRPNLRIRTSPGEAGFLFKHICYWAPVHPPVVKETFSFGYFVGYFVTVQPVFGMGVEYHPLAPFSKGDF